MFLPYALCPSPYAFLTAYRLLALSGAEGLLTELFAWPDRISNI